MPHSLRRTAATLLTAAALALGPAALVAPGSAAAPAPAPVGGTTLVGETSPIHDPALVVADDGTWYTFSTGRVGRENGGTIQIATSHDDGTTWEYAGTVWDEIPAWIDEHFADGALPDNLWAPEVYEHDGTYYLYYSASRFGTDESLTALATNVTLDPADPDYEWVDQGLVVESPVSGLPGDVRFNAIDAGIVEDEAGNPFMAIGSFWYGIFLVPLEWPSGKPVDGWQAQTVNIADRFVAGNPVEAPYITHRDGYYYLFVSFGACCQGADSTYQVAVGRSESVTGPYLDREGQDMYGGGGTILLEDHGAVVGPGGQSVFGDYLAFHYYDASNEEIPYFPTLGIQRLDWVDGWPVTDQRVALPTVVAGPGDVAVTPGSAATFTTTATGIPSPVAEWETSTDGGTTWTDVAEQPRTVLTGAAAAGDEVEAGGLAAAAATDRVASSTLELAAAGAEQDGTLVRARVTNAHGTTLTETATLSVSAAQPPVAPTEPGTEAPVLPAPGPGPSVAVPPTATEGRGHAVSAGSDAVSLLDRDARTPDGPLAETGGSSAPALGAALALVLLGAGSLTLARRRPQTWRRERAARVFSEGRRISEDVRRGRS